MHGAIVHKEQNFLLLPSKTAEMFPKIRSKVRQPNTSECYEAHQNTMKHKYKNVQLHTNTRIVMTRILNISQIFYLF